LTPSIKNVISLTFKRGGRIGTLIIHKTLNCFER
jgi:hypothetical protein